MSETSLPHSSTSSSSSLPRLRRRRRPHRLFNKMLPMFPYLPSYTGPHTVGTIDVEIPISELDSPAPLPDNFDIPTIKARIFYPCEPTKKKAKPVYWIAEPQWQYLEAFYSFLGASSRMSKAIAYSSWFLRSTTIPATRNAPLLKPSTSNGRWPVMVFSHGLGGSRNTYSQICGSVASHGMVVIAPEHRDGSCPATFICNARGENSKIIRYEHIAHEPVPEVLYQRSAQLRIRMAELGFTYDLLLKLEEGREMSNYNKAEDDGNGFQVLKSFTAQVDVLEEGKITWAGHSFGAASVTQFVKSVFWGQPPAAKVKDFKALYSPSRDQKLVSQITPTSPLILLDLWAFPLQDPQTSWLLDQELPCYSAPAAKSPTVLAILSEGFYKWNANLTQTKKVISPRNSNVTKMARMFYAETSAHLSQSDFGVLFPLLTRLVLKAQDPDRIMRLNTRATMEILRQAGIEVSRTSDIDMERTTQKDVPEKTKTELSFSDTDILSTTAGKVRGWIALDLEKKTHSDEGCNLESSPNPHPANAVIEGEIGA